MLIQVIDADYKVLNNRPIVRIFGRSKDGKSVCVFSKGYLPHFYAITQRKEELLQRLAEVKDILEVKDVQKSTPQGYSTKQSDALKITLSIPRLVPEVRDKISDIATCYEADILFKDRFMVDHGIKGMDWIRVEGRKESTSVVKCEAIEAESLKPEESDEMAALKTLAFDIEVSGPRERIPSADIDPIIMIAFSFSHLHKGQKTIVIASKSMPGAEGCENEKAMLERFKETILEYDPDIITGYNINGFDLPYIIDRMRKLGVRASFGRALDAEVYYKRMATSVRVTATGRVIADAYQLIKKAYHFKRYRLQDVSKEILKESKVDVDHKEIKPLWESRNLDDHRKLVEYNRQDAKLALDLLLKTNVLEKYIGLSRVSGVLLQDAIEGGEAKRIDVLLLSEFGKRNILLPNRPNDSEVEKRKMEKEERGLKGGLVLEPMPGLHTGGAILVLDFKSLYPSIIQTYNICPTTLLLENKETGHMAPSGASFASRDVRIGVIPEILEKLIKQRNETKKLASGETNPERKRVLDAKQFGLKIMANAFYGYLGYERARIYIIDIAGAITSYGRSLIGAAKHHIESTYGYGVIYGDTDSLMIKTDIADMEEAHKKGSEISENTTAALKGIIKKLEEDYRDSSGITKSTMPVPRSVLQLEFEKVFRSMLIETKKRYAGLVVKKEQEEWKERFDMRGIEVVRRDWCNLASDTMNSVLEIILRENDPKKAMNYIREKARELEEGKVPLNSLAVTKSISRLPDTYKGRLPHITLARRLGRRDPANAPAVGDRISFVIVRGSSLISERAETPEFIEQNKLPIDAGYYIESQLLPPVERIFESMGIGRDELIGRGKQHKITEHFAPKTTTNDVLEGYTSLVCTGCGKSYQRPTLRYGQNCECGKELVFSNGVSVAKLVMFN